MVTLTIEDGLHVEIHDSVPTFLLRNLVVWGAPGGSGVVHEDIESRFLRLERVRKCVTAGLAL